MQDQVILVVESAKFLMTPEEAFQVAEVLNSCSRISHKWVGGSNKEVIVEPSMDAAVVAPMTAYLIIKLAENAKEEKK